MRIPLLLSDLINKHIKPHYFCAGLRKVTDDMKTKNRADRSGVVSSSAPPPAAPEKTSRAGSFSFKSGPPKLELQMGRK
jgi:adenylyl cyclase-associated protein